MLRSDWREACERYARETRAKALRFDRLALIPKELPKVPRLADYVAAFKKLRQIIEEVR